MRADWDRIKKVLEYYADKKTYEKLIIGYDMIAPIENDKGKLAKELLEDL